MSDRFDAASDSIRVDLRALDPDTDPLEAERFATAVMDRIASSATPPAIPLDPLYGLWSISPAFLVAASILIVAVLGVQREHARNSVGRPMTIAEAVGVPADYVVVGVPHP
jgi:hypothetical protein